MNLAPLLDAPLAIQIHVAACVPAALLGPAIFWKRKGTSSHRLLGKIWLGLMVVAALSSFFIHTINLALGLSPIHLLSVYVLYGSWTAVRAARAGRIGEHRRNVIGIYVGGILVAGGFTLLPGRLMHDAVVALPASSPNAMQLAIFVAIMVGWVLLLAAVSVLTDRLRPGGIRRPG